MRDYQTQPCPSALAHSTFLESQSDRKDRDVEVVVPLSCVRLFVTPWTVAHQASLFIINSQSLLKLMSIESVMPSNHLILCHPLLLLSSIFPIIKLVGSSHQVAKVLELQLQHQFFQYSRLISFRIDWFELLAV